MAKRKRTRRRVRYDAHLFQHLEHVSGKLLIDHADIVRDLIGRQSGIYALYKNDGLYYVGLASKLSSRIKNHLRNRHEGRWDNFSIYLTNNSRHMKEIESLLLQIADPKGNSMGGKPSGSENLRGRLSKAIRIKLRKEADALLGRVRTGRDAARTRLSKSDRSALTYLFPQGAKLRGERNGKRYSGYVRRNGQIRVKGKSYDPPSGAGKAASGRPVNGWYFWLVERSPRNWVRLQEIKQAATPVLRRARAAR